MHCHYDCVSSELNYCRVFTAVCWFLCSVTHVHGAFCKFLYLKEGLLILFGAPLKAVFYLQLSTYERHKYRSLIWETDLGDRMQRGELGNSFATTIGYGCLAFEDVFDSTTRLSAGITSAVSRLGLPLSFGYYSFSNFCIYNH